MMKKLLTALSFGLCLCLSAKAQVIILNDNLFQSRMSEIRTTVLDSLTNEPVGFASVYVVPAKDTTITNFTLSDVKGEAKLEEVPYGSYVFHVEMMGYKPFVKEQYFRERQVDMGVVKLQIDEQFLQAAVVSDVGNPIVIKQDTVEFNASSFRVGANAMLKDLLQRMPGMEITDEGKVKFNGEEIDQLTIGGKTFFFNDQSTALNNLPASVVDKIRVIDRESEQTRASGIQDGAREKILDVALKKEYEKGWFGNVGAKAGYTLGKKDNDDQLRDNRGVLWNGNALVAAYTEKDQVTVIANAQNVSDSNNMVVVLYDEDGERNRLTPGISAAAQFGVNANTSRIKDVETTVSANYKYTDTDSGTRSERTTYQDDGDLHSSSNNGGKSFANSLTAGLEMEKEKGKVWFHLRPSFRYYNTYNLSNGTSETFREAEHVNSSENSLRSTSDSKYVAFDGDVSFRELWGKKDRSIRLSFDGSYDAETGESTEYSALTTKMGTDSRTMTYDSDAVRKRLSGGLQYTEPLGEKWSVSASADFTWAERGNIRNAFDEYGKNEYYSSESNSNSLSQEYEMTAQYKFGKDSWITFGGTLSGLLNETYSKSYGIEEITGKDEWIWFLTPMLRFGHSKGNDRIRITASGYTQRPSVSRMLPVLNISDPSRLGLGNVYLKPYSQSYFNANWTRNNRERFSNLMVYLFGQVGFNSISSALWYDNNGILYSIPVNSPKPSVSVSLSVYYTTPLDASKLWSLSVDGSLSYSSSLSYQAKGTLPGLDEDAFDYSAFMTDFWGNENGDRFFSGQSGFGESRTGVFGPSAGLALKYNPERWSFSAEADTYGRIARYSLNPNADLNTLETKLTARGSYTSTHEFEFGTDLSYVFYNGYSEGYGRPEWQWNAEISKNIGAFNLSVKVYDILNQTRNLTHTVTANYKEDTYRLIMGRYILFGVKWNFGKMNAAHSQRAQRAAWNMVF